MMKLHPLWVTLLLAILLHLDDNNFATAAKRGKGKIQQQQVVQYGNFEEPKLKEIEQKDSKRTGKLFSLFNVVQFQNTACTSQQIRSGTASSPSTLTNTGTATNRAGVCYSAVECSNKGGLASGACAAGFGVCCVFTSTGGIITQNCSYLQNPGFPAALTNTNNVMFTINKCNNNVCSIRLDFETFNILGPARTVEAGGGVCQDTLTFATPGTAYNFPVICGLNTGMHVYLSLGMNTGDTATLNFAFAGNAAGTRMFDIKATQVLCGVNNPSNGCFQYFSGISGQIMTFNFANAGQTHLANQQYTACIRQAAGFCCVEYQVCPGVTNAFTLNQAVTKTVLAMGFGKGLIDSQCSMDFVMIAGATAQCGMATNTQLVSRFCGTFFSTISTTVGVNKSPVNIPICDCSQPFGITIVTNNTPDKFSTQLLSHGVCLQYMQLPCSTTM